MIIVWLKGLSSENDIEGYFIENRPEVRKQWVYAMDLDFHRVP